ncbi:MAG: ADP-ribosylglycohydrolase family protein [Firmicutes bacterium]|nr:ADP-ribosylglycohydrolase family protein [Bacillota bacterium]
MDKREKNRKLADAVFGLAIGDALGVPYEFKNRGAFECTEMTGYGTHGQPAGTWSDDTSMTIATAKSIKDNGGKIVPVDIRDNFVAWADDEGFNANGVGFDIGSATWVALSTGEPQTGERSNGNGSLMRILPLAFAECTDEEVMQVSAITHGHEISMHACVIYVRIARRLLAGESIHDIIPTLMYEEPFDRLRKIDQLPEKEVESSGYVVHTLEAALWTLAKYDNFRDTVLAAVNLGDDTDTTAAVAGGLAGIVYGLDSDFAQECLEVLRAKDMIEECLW